MNFIQSCLVVLSIVSIFASEIDQSAPLPIDDVTINQKEGINVGDNNSRGSSSASEDDSELEERPLESQQQRQLWLMHHFEQHHADMAAGGGSPRASNIAAVVDHSATKANAVVASVAVSNTAAANDDDDDLVVAIAPPALDNTDTIATADNGNEPDPSVSYVNVAETMEEQKSQAPPVTTSLQTDLFEFIDLIPVDEVNELKVRYYVSDPQVRKAYDYLQNYDYGFVSETLGNMVEVQTAINFLTAKGLNLKEVWQAVYERLGPPNNSMTEQEGE